jgi:hypothetical protein
MNLPWFRMYGEFLTDPLIRLLSFEDQRHFIAALCMKSQGVTDKRYATVTVRKNVISSLIGLSCEAAGDGVSALDRANERLRALGLVDEDWQPTNWNKRQFASDHVDKTAAERMRRYRAKRNVTPVTSVVTALDSEQIQIQNRTEKKKTVTPLPPCEGLDLQAWEAWKTYREKIRKPLKPVSIASAQRELAKHGGAQSAVVEQSIANGWTGLFALKAELSGWRERPYVKPLSVEELEAREHANAS